MVLAARILPYLKRFCSRALSFWPTYRPLSKSSNGQVGNISDECRKEDNPAPPEKYLKRLQQIPVQDGINSFCLIAYLFHPTKLVFKCRRHIYPGKKLSFNLLLHHRSIKGKGTIISADQDPDGSFTGCMRLELSPQEQQHYRNYLNYLLNRGAEEITWDR